MRAGHSNTGKLEERPKHLELATCSELQLLGH